MKILIVADNLDSFDLINDSTYVMMQQLALNHHEIYAAEIQNLYLKSNLACAKVKLINLNSIENNAFFNTDKWYKITDEDNTGLENFDAVLMRKDPPFNLAYMYATHILQYAQTKGVLVLNN